MNRDETMRQAIRPVSECMGQAMRQTAKGVLLEKAERLRAEAHRLECLAREMPDHLSPQADEALWGLISR